MTEFRNKLLDSSSFREVSQEELLTLIYECFQENPGKVQHVRTISVKATDSDGDSNSK